METKKLADNPVKVEDKPYVRSTPEEIAQRNYRAYEDKEAIAKLNIKTN